MNNIKKNKKLALISKEKLYTSCKQLKYLRKCFSKKIRLKCFLKCFLIMIMIMMIIIRISRFIECHFPMFQWYFTMN